MDAQPPRPYSVHAEAFWETDGWAMGMRDAAGRTVGPWTWWSANGTLACRSTFNASGKLSGLLERWHPNVERAQWAMWVDGLIQGMLVFTRPSSGPPDLQSTFPTHLSLDVVRMDIPYVDGVPVPHEANYYLEEGRNAPILADDSGRSIDLGKHLGRIAPHTNLRRITNAFQDIYGELVTRLGAEQDGPWMFRGAIGSDWVIAQKHFKDWDEYVVSPEEMSSAFTLSADYVLAQAIRKNHP